MDINYFNEILSEKDRLISILRDRIEGRDKTIKEALEAKDELIGSLQDHINQLQGYVGDLREGLQRSHAIILSQRQQATADNNYGYPQGLFWQTGEA